MPDPADPTALAGSAGERTMSSARAPGRARSARTERRAPASPEGPSRWALALFWACTAFTTVALVLLVTSFLP